jgi:hypothetical protein
MYESSLSRRNTPLKMQQCHLITPPTIRVCLVSTKVDKWHARLDGAKCEICIQKSHSKFFSNQTSSSTPTNAYEKRAKKKRNVANFVRKRRKQGKLSTAGKPPTLFGVKMTTRASRCEVIDAEKTHI